VAHDRKLVILELANEGGTEATRKSADAVERDPER
jgi:hypothetical protein